MLLETLILLSAGFFGGFLNSVAGGGSFITFPALLFVGINPISANATNTFAACAGYLSGNYAFRHELAAHKKELLPIVVISLIGGIAGAWLLLQTPEARFRQAIPWLLLFATPLFIFSEAVNRRLKQLASHHRHASLLGRVLLLLLLLSVALYGGFFNAGLGIIALSYLSLAGHTNINAMNGIKLLISSAVSLIAVALFISDGVIAWREGAIVLSGSLVGGYLAAHLSRKIPQHLVKTFVAVISCAITAYFFIDVYAVA